jgi:hypothetical protein
MRRAPVLRSCLTAAAAGTILGACFTSTADFATDAEDFIAERVAPELDVDFVSVECDEPERQDVGTRFACTATDTDGDVWTFDNEITDENEFTVNLDRRP